MNTVGIKFKRLSETAILPRYETPGSAGADLCADIPHAIPVQPGETIVIPTGIAMAIPEGYAIFICPRSGLSAKNHVTVHNGPGVIDSDYRKGLGVILHNTHYRQFTVHPGDRIAQMVVLPVFQALFEEAEDLGTTERSGGFGSTGVSARAEVKVSGTVTAEQMKALSSGVRLPLGSVAELCARGLSQDVAQQMRNRAALNDDLALVRQDRKTA